MGNALARGGGGIAPRKRLRSLVERVQIFTAPCTSEYDGATKLHETNPPQKAQNASELKVLFDRLIAFLGCIISAIGPLVRPTTEAARPFVSDKLIAYAMLKLALAIFNMLGQMLPVKIPGNTRFC